MKTPEHIVAISPVGEIPEDLSDAIRHEIERVFGYRTELTILLDDIEFAHDTGREQYHSTPILAKLEKAAPENAVKVLAITREDLFIPILTHVYGEAQLGGMAAVVSVNRLKEGLLPDAGDEVFIGRAVKEAVHELGHTFKLLHCKDKTCIMHYCRSIKDVDRKSNQLCRYCKIMMEDEKKRLAKEFDLCKDRDN